MKHWKTILAALVVVLAAVLLWRDARSLPATWDPYPSDVTLIASPQTYHNQDGSLIGLEGNKMPETLVSLDTDTTTLIPFFYPKGDGDVGTISGSSAINNFIAVETRIVTIGGEAWLLPHYYGETVIPWWRKPIHIAAEVDSLASSWNTPGMIDSVWAWSDATGARIYWLSY